MMNFSRQLKTFNKEAFNKAHGVTVIGAGAGGSHLVYNLAKMGVEGIKVYDYDVVEEHNIPNQLYDVTDVGKQKVEALQQKIADITGSYKHVEPHDQWYTQRDAQYESSSIVYLAVDTMKARTDLFGVLCKNPEVHYIIDGRMGGDSLRIYFIPTYSMSKIEKYRETLYTDKEAEKSLCGTTVSVGATANILASLKAWQVIRIQRDTDEVQWWEMFFDIERMNMVTF